MKALFIGELKARLKSKFCYMCNANILIILKIPNYAVHGEIPTMLYKSSNYGFHLMIKHLANIYDSNDSKCS